MDISFAEIMEASKPRVEDGSMPAYMIVTVRVHDRERFLEVYGKPTAALTPRLGWKYICVIYKFDAAHELHRADIGVFPLCTLKNPMISDR